jgi:hypothetical protein
MNRVVCDHKQPDGFGGYSPSVIGTARAEHADKSESVTVVLTRSEH